MPPFLFFYFFFVVHIAVITMTTISTIIVAPTPTQNSGINVTHHLAFFRLFLSIVCRSLYTFSSIT